MNPRSHIEVGVSVRSKVSGNAAKSRTDDVLWVGGDRHDSGILEPEARSDAGTTGILTGINGVTIPLEVQVIERVGKRVHLGRRQNFCIVESHVVVGPVAVAFFEGKTEVRHQVVVVIEVADIDPVTIGQRVVEPKDVLIYVLAARGIKVQDVARRIWKREKQAGYF